MSRNPGSFGERWVVRRRCHDARELGDHRKLLVAIQRSGVREHLHSNVSVVTVDIRQAVGGSSCTNAAVFLRNRAISGTRSIAITACARSSGERVGVVKRAGRGIHVDHRHCGLQRPHRRAVAAPNSARGGPNDVDHDRRAGTASGRGCCRVRGGGAHALGRGAFQLGWTVRSLLATMYQLGFDRQATPGAFRLNRSAAGA